MATDGEAPDYYELLCVEPNATKDDIRKAYRRQALLFHPDKMKPHMQDEASQHFQLISEAYEVLSDGMSLLSYCSWLCLPVYLNRGFLVAQLSSCLSLFSSPLFDSRQETRAL